MGKSASQRGGDAAPAWPAASVEIWPIDRVSPDPNNTNEAHDLDAIEASIVEFGFTIPVLIREGGMLIAGEGRWKAAKRMGLGEIPVIIARGWTEAQCRAYSIADNRIAALSSLNPDAVKRELEFLKSEGFKLELTGFAGKDLDLALKGALERETPANGSLAERFGVPPFSVLNAREGWWQDRKRAWLALGIQSEVGRGENLLAFSDTLLEPDPQKRKAKNGKRKAATFGQDLMRGEHTVGEDASAGRIPGGAPIPLDRKKATATPGGSKMLVTNYSKSKARGDGRGRALP